MKKKLAEPKNWSFNSFICNSGSSIRYGHAEPDQGIKVKGTVVVTGGYGRSIECYYEAINKWVKRGYKVYAMDWDGQGGSDREDPAKPLKPSSKDFDHHVDVFHEFVSTVVKPPANKPAFLSSHSKGANIMLRYIEKHQNTKGYPFTGAVLGAPLIDVQTSVLPRATAKRLLDAAYALGVDDINESSSFTKLKSLRDRFKPRNDAPDNKRKKARVKNQQKAGQDLEVGYPSISWLRHAFKSADIVKKKDFLSRIKTPVLIITPEKDNLVCLKSQRQAGQWMPRARQVDMKGAIHGVWYDVDEVQEKLWDEIDNFVDEAEKEFYAHLPWRNMAADGTKKPPPPTSGPKKPPPAPSP